MNAICSYVTDVEKEVYVLILTENVFRRLIQKKDYFRYFFPFIFCSIIYLFEKRKTKGANACLP